MRALCARDDLSREQIEIAIAPFNIAGLDDHSRQNWHSVNAADLFAGADKLGASDDEIDRLLVRSGFNPAPG